MTDKGAMMTDTNRCCLTVAAAATWSYLLPDAKQKQSTMFFVVHLSNGTLLDGK